MAESRIMKQVAENFEKQKKLLATHMAQTKAKKQKQKAEKAGKKSKGGSDSGSNSRASTPVSDRPSLRTGKRSLADDEVSTSSKDEETSNPPTVTPVTTKEGASTRKKAKKEESVDDSIDTILSGNYFNQFTLTTRLYCVENCNIIEEKFHINGTKLID